MSEFKFSVGPWNVHTGADSYEPERVGGNHWRPR